MPEHEAFVGQLLLPFEDASATGPTEYPRAGDANTTSVGANCLAQSVPLDEAEPTVHEQLGGLTHELSPTQELLFGSLGLGGPEMVRAARNYENDVAAGRTGMIALTGEQIMTTNTGLDGVRRAIAPSAYDALIQECTDDKGTVNGTLLAARIAAKAERAAKRRATRRV